MVDDIVLIIILYIRDQTYVVKPYTLHVSNVIECAPAILYTTYYTALYAISHVEFTHAEVVRARIIQT